jgi:hypothetical protein
MAATELRWACYGFARLKIELCIHIVLLACFLIFASTLPEASHAPCTLLPTATQLFHN